MSEKHRIDLGYRAREQFIDFHARTQRWACIVAHRRAGKTVSCIMDLIVSALQCKKPNGRYAYMAPTYAQAKDVVWQYLKQYTLLIPGVEQRESDLMVNLPNGARIRLYGADNYDRMRGLYFDHVILDEYGDMDPRAWPEVIRPALSDRQGGATFIGTPKGRNHFAQVWDDAVGDPAWYRLILRADQTGILNAEELADMRKTLTEDQFNQEMLCSFDGALVGAYYAHAMAEAETSSRIGRVPWEPKVLTHTAWDLGMRDSTAIWCFQTVNNEVRVIDYIENSGQPLGWYVNALRERPYTWGEHILPHDVEVKELGTGQSRLETLRGLGIQATVLPAGKVYDGINAVRQLIPRCWFDADKCKQGISALRQYRREYDEKRKVFHDRPLHDWTSHASDAFRYLAMGMPEERSAWSKPISYGKTGIV